MCEITAGFNTVCDSAGGVKKAYGWSVKDNSGVSNYDTLTYANGTISALTLVAGKYAYPVSFEIETSTYTDTAIGARGTSSYAREQSATLVLAGNTAAMIDEIENWAKSRVAIAFELNDGSYEVLFLENGGKTIDARTPGTTYEDMNGNTLTVSGREKTKAMKVSAEIIAALLEPAS